MKTYLISGAFIALIIIGLIFNWPYVSINAFIAFILYLVNQFALKYFYDFHTKVFKLHIGLILLVANLSIIAIALSIRNSDLQNSLWVDYIFIFLFLIAFNLVFIPAGLPKRRLTKINKKLDKYFKKVGM